jgi:hypothetical protein
LLALLLAFGLEQWGGEEAVGLLAFISLAAICGAIELTHMQASRATAIVGLVAASIALVAGLRFPF